MAARGTGTESLVAAEGGSHRPSWRSRFARKVAVGASFVYFESILKMSVQTKPTTSKPKKPLARRKSIEFDFGDEDAMRDFK